MSDEAPGEIRVRLGLRWRDVDMLGHVNQSVYHELLEEARTVLLAHVAEGREKGAWVLAHVDLDFRHEVRRDDAEVDAVVWITKVGRRSLTMRNEVRLTDGTLCAEGTAVIVAWDAAGRGARDLTADERAALDALGAPAT